MSKGLFIGFVALALLSEYEAKLGMHIAYSQTAGSVYLCKITAFSSNSMYLAGVVSINYL
ncbi:hypothetical protein BH23THE1_BH23THE1_26800 [soil metagenome]